MTEPHPLLQNLKQKHAEAHRKMCEDGATSEDILFYKGMWLAYNDAIGEVEHISITSAEKVLDELELWVTTQNLSGEPYGLLSFIERLMKKLAELRERERR